jgi:hypothetical protein
MRSPQVNPFLPGSDAIPPVWAGRSYEIADFIDIVSARRLAGIYERGRIVIGEPGIGKSVLVNRLAVDAREAGHWVLPGVRLAAGDNPVTRLLAATRTLLESRRVGAALGAALTRVFERVTEVTVPVVGGGVRLADPRPEAVGHELLTEVLIELAAAAGGDNRLLFVRVDEVQHLEGSGLSQLLTSLGDTLNAEAPSPPGIETKLPFAVYLSGLPEFYARASAAGATFARRFKPLELGPLEDADLQLALTAFTTDGWEILGDEGPTTVRMAPAAAEVVIEAAHGSPFLFQLVGEAAWNAGSGEVITVEEAVRGVAATRRETAAHFDLRLSGLTDLQQDYLRAAALLAPEKRTAGEVAARLGSTSPRLASTARTLDERHRLIRRRGGKIRFRSPGLLEYLRGMDD